MTIVDVDEIETRCAQGLRRHGAPDRVARVMAEAIAWAEARDNRICGLAYFESYCVQLRTGRVDGAAEPVVTTPRDAVVHVDARFGFAQMAFIAGREAALSAAKRYGVATLALSHAHTCTALGWFTERLATGGVIALGATNASPIVAPPGGAKRIIGTNPLAFAVPDGAGGIATAFDMATTAVTLGRITAAKAAGTEIPEGWAVDRTGAPTSDPEAALAGSLVSAGGPKGWGLGVMVEILAAAMTGGRLSRDVAPLKAPEGPPHDLGQFFVLIDPDASADFGARLADLIAAVDADTGRLPGRHKRPADRVEVPDALWKTVRTLEKG